MAGGKVSAVNEAQLRALSNGLIKFLVDSYKTGHVERQQAADKLSEYVNEQVQNFLNGWEIHAQSALTVSQMPQDEDSKVYWYIALLGNMIWAGTCLLNPESAAAAIIIMSFSGAAVGSGSIEQLYKNPPEKPDDAKKLIAGEIAQKRDELETQFRKERYKWASEIVALESWESNKTPNDLIDMADAYIWKKMFPRILYTDKKYSTIFQGCVSNITAMLVDFNNQWHQWLRNAAWFGEAERKRRNMYFKYIQTVSFDVGGAQLPKPAACDPGKFC